MVWREVTLLVLNCALVASALGTMGAVPGQDERPPQPFFRDFFSGTVSLQGAPPPSGTQLIACVDSCVTWFESLPVQLQPEGRYDLLEVNPSDEASIGRLVSFYLINEFGRIKAAKTRGFVGVFDFYTVNLTFNDPLPVPTPTPTVTPIPTLTPTAVLPVPGDPGVTAIPRLALIIGAASVAAGAGLILLARRRAQ